MEGGGWEGVSVGGKEGFWLGQEWNFYSILSFRQKVRYLCMMIQGVNKRIAVR